MSASPDGQMMRIIGKVARRRIAMRIALAAVGITLALTLAGTAAEAGAARPATLAVSPAPIEDLAVARGQVAWASYWPSEGFGAVWVENMRTKKRVRLPVFGSGAQAWTMELLGFAGGRAVWSDAYYLRSMEVWEAYVSTASVADRRVRVLADGIAVHRWVTDTDRAPLVYAPLIFPITNWEECGYHGPEPPTEACLYGTDGSLHRVVDGRLRRLPGLPIPARFSAHRGRVAVVPADPAPTTAPWKLPIATPVVEVRRLRDGSLVHRVELSGTPRAVTLWRGFVTVLSEDDAGRRTVERYGREGTFLGATPVSRRTAPRLDSDGRWVVFSVGRRINALDAATGSVRALHRVRTPPIDLQAIGGRVYWAANGRGHGRVLSLPLPSR